MRLNNEDELIFKFTFFIRQTIQQTGGVHSDTAINGLTFAYASNIRDLDNLVTREFHADPNLHKNSNVQLIGDYSTENNSAIQFDWTWTWRPPKLMEDKGNGWRNTCSFLEYDQRAHRLNTLATFSFWVANPPRIQATPVTSPGFELSVPPRLRVPSSQSYQSRISDSEGPTDIQDPPSPIEPPLEPSTSGPAAAPVTVDVSCKRPAEDIAIVDDGPLFRATMKSLESKTGSMRSKIKKVLKKAEAAHQAQVETNLAVRGFLSALQDASTTNASAVKPALDHYFNHTAQLILQYEVQNSSNLQRLIIDPLSKLYNLDIKQAESKKKDFEDESRDYYAYLGRYLGQRQDSLKEKKRAESDSKYQSKRRTFELARFDYSSFMQDLHGGRKEQELLSQLTKYADQQAQSFLGTAKRVEEMSPQLDALIRGVADADKEFRLQRTEREEKRRTLEKSNMQYNEPGPEVVPQQPPASISAVAQGTQNTTDPDLGRADSTASYVSRATNGTSLHSSLSNASNTSTIIGTSPITTQSSSAVATLQNRFKGIRDLEEREINQPSASQSSGPQRKEGLLWALSRPGSHIDPKGMNKQAWHK